MRFLRTLFTLALTTGLGVLSMGCMAETPDSDEVGSIDEPALEGEVSGSAPYIYCWHQPDLWCSYWGYLPGDPWYANTYWEYDYTNTWWTDGPIYVPSGSTVNWGTCQDPGGGQASFMIRVRAWNTSFGNGTEIYMPCK